MENNSHCIVLPSHQTKDNQKNRHPRLLSRMQLSTFSGDDVSTQRLESNTNYIPLNKLISGHPRESESLYVQNATVSSTDDSSTSNSSSPPPLPPKPEHLKAIMGSTFNGPTNWKHVFQTSSANSSVADCQSTRSSVLSFSDTSSIYWVVDPSSKPKRAAPPPPPIKMVTPPNSQGPSEYANKATISRGGLKISHHLGHMTKRTPFPEEYQMTVFPNSSSPTDSLVDSQDRTVLIHNPISSFNKPMEDDLKPNTSWNHRRKIMTKENFAFDGTDNPIFKRDEINSDSRSTLILFLALLLVLGSCLFYFLFDDYYVRQQLIILQSEIEQLKTSSLVQNISTTSSNDASQT